jgi:hypothetical protein
MVLISADSLPTLHELLHMAGGSGWFATPRKLWTLPPQLTAIAQVCCSDDVMKLTNALSSPIPVIASGWHAAALLDGEHEPVLA